MSLLAVLHHACETADIAWTCPQTLAGGFVADAIPHSQGAGCSSACFEWSRSGRFSHEVCPFTLLARSHVPVCYLALPVLSPVPISTWHTVKLCTNSRHAPSLAPSLTRGARVDPPRACGWPGCGAVGVRALLTVGRSRGAALSHFGMFLSCLSVYREHVSHFEGYFILTYFLISRVLRSISLLL